MTKIVRMYLKVRLAAPGFTERIFRVSKPGEIRTQSNAGTVVESLTRTDGWVTMVKQGKRMEFPRENIEFLEVEEVSDEEKAIGRAPSKVA